MIGVECNGKYGQLMENIWERVWGASKEENQMQLAHLITDAYQNQVALLPSWGGKKKPNNPNQKTEC